MVFDTVYYEQIYEFAMHSNPINYMVNYNERYVFSNCMEGKVYHWEIHDVEKPSGKYENPDRVSKEQYANCFAHDSAKPYTDFVYDPDHDLFVGCLPEKTLIVYTSKGTNMMFEYFNKDMSYTSLCLVKNAKVLLCGTSKGSICVHLWPPVLTERELRDYPQVKVFREIEFAEFQPQLFPISLMSVTPKEDSLITVSSDGMIFILKMDVLDKPDTTDDSSPPIGDQEDIGQTINELFLVKNSYIMQQARAIRNKEMEVARYEKKKISDAENKHRENRAKLSKIEKLFEQSKQSSKDHQARFLLHSQETIKKQSKLKEELKSQLDEKVDELTNETESMVNYERERNAQLIQDFEFLKLQKKEFLETTAQEQVETQNKLAVQFNASLKELKNKYNTILEDAGKYGDEFLKKIRLHEIDNERQIHHKSSDLNRQISDMITAHESIQKVNDKLSQANDQKSKEDVKKQQEFEEEFIENTKLQEKKVRIVVNLLKIQEQLLEREQVVFSKDETIKMARDEQINLENFQFMLDQKIKSLKANKSKLNEEIDSKEKILRDMFNELIKQSQANNSLNKDIKDRLQKMQILGEHMRKIDLNIYYWSVKIKDYHRKIMSKINTTKKSNEVKMLVNKLISDSNIEQAKNPERVIDEKKVLGIANASSDVGTSVHKELIEQNMWLIKKLNMIDQAADNIKRIREENIDTGLSQNKKLIEECNKLNVDNDILHKKHSHFAKIIESVNKLKKEEQQKTANLMKHNRENGPTKMAGSSMLPRLLQNQVSEVSESRQSEARLSKGKPAGPPSGVSNNRGIISVSHTVIKKRPGPALRR